MKKTSKDLAKMLSAFPNNVCKNGNLINEAKKLQKQMGDATTIFGFEKDEKIHVAQVVERLKKVNEECGDVVTNEQMKSFTKKSLKFSGMITSEIAGKKGEKAVFNAIMHTPRRKRILRNIELKGDDLIAEIDFVVITDTTIFLIETKNPSIDITIDEKGNYCRERKGKLVYDKNIGEKMSEKEYLLKKALQKAGMEDIPVCSLVVFANNDITVTNKFKYINEHYISHLPYIIRDANGEITLSQKQIYKIEKHIKRARYKGKYNADIDVISFKKDFVKICEILIEAKQLKESNEEAQKKKKGIFALFFKNIAKAFCFTSNS